MSDVRVTLLVAAEAREFTGLMERAEKSERLAWPVQFARRVQYCGNTSLLVADGPGPRLAAHATTVAVEQAQVGAVVSTGFCGALDPDLAPSGIFIAQEVMGIGPALALGDSGHTSVSYGKLISNDRVAVTAEEKAALRKTGGDAVEMEAAGVAREAGRLSLPFYCVRVVTDTAGESLPLDFNLLRDRHGRFSRARILAAALRNPRRIFPKLMTLNQRCRSASSALGEFLVNCRF